MSDSGQSTRMLDIDLALPPLLPAAEAGGPVAVLQGQPNFQNSLDLVFDAAERLERYREVNQQILREAERLVAMAKDERAYLNDLIDQMEQKIHELEDERLTATARLIDSQLECWSLRVRLRAMEEAAAFNARYCEPRRDREVSVEESRSRETITRTVRIR